MKKIHTFILIIIFAGCCKEPELLKNGLTKKANKITELTIKVNDDSLNIRNLDTIGITDKYYNNNNQITKRINNFLFDSSVIKIDFVYDNSDKLVQEIVKSSFDTTMLNYFYKDNLLYKTSSININDEFHFEQTSVYKYNRKNKLSEISTSQLSVTLEFKDTFINTLEITKYNGDEKFNERKMTDFLHPKRSSRNSYKYKSGRFSSHRSYNDKDSLISIIKFEYTFDEFNNWIEMKSKEGNELKYIRKREIEYN